MKSRCGDYRVPVAAKIDEREWVAWGFAYLTLTEALRRLRAVNADRNARGEQPLGEPPFTGPLRAATGLEADEVELLSEFVGKRLVAFEKGPYGGEGDHWMDDEPLVLTFEDGTKLSVSAAGFHQSGCLGVARGD